MNHSSHFSDGVIELSGTDDHLHLEDVAFGDAALHQTLQHLLLVQSDAAVNKPQSGKSALIINTDDKRFVARLVLQL